MPTINQTNTIDIPVEKFLRACSKTELQELDLLLPSYLKHESKNKNLQPSFDAFFQTLKEITTPEYYQEIKNLYIGINPRNFEAFIHFVKQGFIPSAVFAAMKIIDSICQKTVLEPMEVVNLMRDFDGLENLRKISLVKKPQLINKTEEDERSM